jgi:D-alanyl-D-alanine carboxypeptidase
MRLKIFLLSFSILLSLSASLPVKALGQVDLARRIEILKYEISLLQMLISNWQLQGPITASSYLAVDLSDNSVLLEKNPDKSYSIASVTKLMTAVIALENIDMDSEITLSEEMLTPLGQSPSLFEGLDISAENLLKASLIQSSNDAAESLSYFLDKEEFIGLMNKKAQQLGMDSTVFYDVHGLNSANSSRASDLVKLLAYIQENHAEILGITKSNDFWLPNEAGDLLKFQNVNNFYPLPAFIGGKTGYLPEARQTLASIFEVNGKQVAIVLLHSANRQADAFAILKELR